MDRLVSRAFSATLVRDGITYEVVLSVESLRIAAGATSGSLTFKASAYRRVGDGARAAYSCYFAAFKRTGTSHATGVRTTSKATSWNRTSAISVASTVNAVVVYRSARKPENILKICKSIERSMGRTDPPEYAADGSRIYHDRIIDIDILMYGDLAVRTPTLTIPHPQVESRPFVKVLLEQLK